MKKMACSITIFFNFRSSCKQFLVMVPLEKIHRNQVLEKIESIQKDVIRPKTLYKPWCEDIIQMILNSNVNLEKLKVLAKILTRFSEILKEDKPLHR